MASFDDIKRAVSDSVKKLVEDNWSEFRDAALKDGKEFVAKTAKDIKRWTDLLAEGRLTRGEFASLVRAKSDLASMHALTVKGLGEIRLQRFRAALGDAVSKAVIGTVLT